MFPSDAIARAKQMLGYVGSIGAYSDSRGAAGIRQEIGNFIQKRDGSATASPTPAAASTSHTNPSPLPHADLGTPVPAFGYLSTESLVGQTVHTSALRPVTSVLRPVTSAPPVPAATPPFRR